MIKLNLCGDVATNKSIYQGGAVENGCRIMVAGKNEETDA